jgi:hypothetical protein
VYPRGGLTLTATSRNDAGVASLTYHQKASIR